jgi:hypothetical protein
MNFVGSYGSEFCAFLSQLTQLICHAIGLIGDRLLLASNV